MAYTTVVMKEPHPPQLDAIAQRVQDEVMAVAESTLSKLRENWPDLAAQLKPSIKPGKWESVFSVSLNSDDGIPVNKRGSGVRRLILLSFFRARVEQLNSSEGSRPVVYAIEEPETSQHPENQRRIVDVLQTLAAQVGVQVLFTTHTPTLVASLATNDLRYVTQINGLRTVQSASDDIYRKIANELGVLPDHRVRVFVMLEGTNDINFLRRLSRTLNAANPSVPILSDLEDQGLIALIPLGGATLKLWVKNNYLKELRRPEFHLYDRDSETNPQYAPAVADVNARRDGSFATLTTKRELESYLHPDAVAGAKKGVAIQIGDWDDVPAMVAEQLHAQGKPPKPWSSLDDREKSRKSNAAKSWLNIEAADRMTIERIRERDPNGEIEGWLLKIQSMVAAG